MRDDNTKDMMQEAEDMAAAQEDPRVLAVIEEVLERVRTILDLFEGIMHEVWNLAQIVADMFKEIRSLFRINQPQEDAEYEPLT